MVESIEQVTAEQVQVLSAEFFHPDRIALTLLGELNGLRIGRKDLVC